MKKIGVAFCSLVLLLGFTGVSFALTYTSTYDPADVYMNEFGFGGQKSISWTFDITTPGGFNPVTQDVTSASVKLNLRDDSNIDWLEEAKLIVGLNTFTWEVDTGTTTSFMLTSLMTLSDTGKVDATLTATGGDFYFNSATLTAEGTAPVPEPGTIVLLSAGLLGLTVYGKRRMNNKEA